MGNSPASNIGYLIHIVGTCEVRGITRICVVGSGGIVRIGVIGSVPSGILLVASNIVVCAKGVGGVRSVERHDEGVNLGDHLTSCVRCVACLPLY